MDRVDYILNVWKPKLTKLQLDLGRWVCFKLQAAALRLATTSTGEASALVVETSKTLTAGHSWNPSSMFSTRDKANHFSGEVDVHLREDANA